MKGSSHCFMAREEEVLIGTGKCYGVLHAIFVHPRPHQMVLLLFMMDFCCRRVDTPSVKTESNSYFLARCMVYTTICAVILMVPFWAFVFGIHSLWSKVYVSVVFLCLTLIYLMMAFCFILLLHLHQGDAVALNY